MVDNFAESSKRKAAVWPLQIMLLILCPVRKLCYYCAHTVPVHCIVITCVINIHIQILQTDIHQFLRDKLREFN